MLFLALGAMNTYTPLTMAGGGGADRLWLASGVGPRRAGIFAWAAAFRRKAGMYMPYELPWRGAARLRTLRLAEERQARTPILYLCYLRYPLPHRTWTSHLSEGRDKSLKREGTWQASVCTRAVRSSRWTGDIAGRAFRWAIPGWEGYFHGIRPGSLLPPLLGRNIGLDQVHWT